MNFTTTRNIPGFVNFGINEKYWLKPQDILKDAIVVYSGGEKNDDLSHCFQTNT